MSSQVILLERIEKLGNMGEVVKVRPGYARNYLLPQKKALRATKENIAYFEAQRKHLEAENDKRRAEAEKLAKKLEGTKVAIIRQASESGQLYGSVTSRDIAEEISGATDVKIERHMVVLNQNFKTIGLFPVPVRLHPEVSVDVTVNVARTADEAETQAKTGKALIADLDQQEEAPAEEETQADTNLEEVLEESALEAEKEKQAAADAKAEEDAAKAAKAEAKKAEKETRAAAETAEAEAAETEETAEEAPESEGDAEEEKA